MGVSRVQVHIERVVLKGIDAGDGSAFVEGLRAELSRVLSIGVDQADGYSSRRTPVLRLGRMTMESGRGGSRRFGRQVAGSIARGITR